jgi:tryptophanase
MDLDNDRRRRPFKIKMVEPLKWNSKAEREALMKKADYCWAYVPAEEVPINLTTDSGTSAMSQDQWSAMFKADESYFNRKDFYVFEKAVQDFAGFKYVLPAHQGRAAENLLCNALIKPGDVVPANAHFGTTEAHARRLGANPINLPIDEALDTRKVLPFKGDVDLKKLKALIDKHGAKKVSFLNMVMTNNFTAGQPVSMANLKAASKLCHDTGIKVVIDSARVAENAYFIKEKESGYKNKSIREICREIYSYADAMHMSAKKGALVNMGGFVATNDENLYNTMAGLLIQLEGYTTYGGLTGRDLEALATGLNEGLDYEYLADRIGQVEFFAKKLRERGIPFYEPPGGHGVYVDAVRFYPHLPKEELSAQACVVETYIESGVGSAENPSSLGWSRTNPETGKYEPPPFELVRFAIPRRAYVDSQLEYAADGLRAAMDKGEKVKGFKIKWVPENEFLRIFFYRLQRLM